MTAFPDLSAKEKSNFPVASKGAMSLFLLSDWGFRRARGQVLFGTDEGYIQQFDTSEEFKWMSRSGMSFQEMSCPSRACHTTLQEKHLANLDHASYLSRFGHPVTGKAWSRHTLCTANTHAGEQDQGLIRHIFSTAEEWAHRMAGCQQKAVADRRHHKCNPSR
jgi:hypothetical protein